MTCLEESQKRTCADERCGKALPAGKAGAYCERKCRVRVAKRVRDRAANPGRPARRVPAFIRRMREEAPAGRCVYCEAALAPRQRFLCVRRECRTAYNSDWRRERNACVADGQEEGGEEREARDAAEAAVEFRAGRERLAVQFDSARAALRELRERIEALTFDNLNFEESPKPHEGRNT
ncbi:hypothetical protein [Myxococcus sp. CA040A]|uniref:hypothetical protein n=1 Tax=Myxococcus sp. CA040A TaxID=2741738 RepID=UPI00157BAC2E|nr:hypothetical protein [Myxococcus sp. CA040A]NTX08914.1 hypothetical protein [Myxococcus sp. CA040A]